MANVFHQREKMDHNDHCWLPDYFQEETLIPGGGICYQSLLSLICGLTSITTPRKSNLATKTGERIYIIRIGP